jgi:hypothetical protein
MNILTLVKNLLHSVFGEKKSNENKEVLPNPSKGIPYKLEPQEKVEKRIIMELEVLRYSSQKESTLGALFDVSDGRGFLCYTLEDEYRTKKKYSETRIPAGRYQITLRTEGGFHQKYSDRFGDKHKGMLWVRDVPNFEYVLIHIGNKDDDTAGCLLVGDSSIQNITEEGFVGNSTAAYLRVYPKIAEALSRGEEVYITYVDYDDPKIA